MPLSHPYQSVPVGSISFIPERDRMKYILLYEKVPEKIQSVLSSPDTGSYILGLTRSYDIIKDQSPVIGFAILRIAVGEKTLAQLPGIFSTELSLPSDQAQKMASEIEHDIFGPIKAELDAFLTAPKGSEAPKQAPVAPPQPRSTTPRNPAPNLLDLKEITAAKKQEQLTAKPQTPLISSRTPLRPGATRGTGGETTSAPKFPLPPKPPITPINLTGY